MDNSIYICRSFDKYLESIGVSLHASRLNVQATVPQYAPRQAFLLVCEAWLNRRRLRSATFCLIRSAVREGSPKPDNARPGRSANPWSTRPVSTRSEVSYHLFAALAAMPRTTMEAIQIGTAKSSLTDTMTNSPSSGETEFHMDDPTYMPRRPPIIRRNPMGLDISIRRHPAWKLRSFCYIYSASIADNDVH